MSSTRSPGADSRRQHRSGLPPVVSACAASRLPASSAPAALISCSVAGGIGSKMSLPPAGVPATFCSQVRLVTLGRRWEQPEREMWRRGCSSLTPNAAGHAARPTHRQVTWVAVLPDTFGWRAYFFPGQGSLSAYGDHDRAP